MLSKFEQVCQGNEKGRSEVSENELRSSPIPRVFLYHDAYIQQRFGRRLYPIPPLNWIKGKKRISGILYVNTIPRTKQRVQEEILFLPLSLSLLFFLSFSFFPSRDLQSNTRFRPGRITSTWCPHRECFSVVSWNLMEFGQRVSVI